MFAYRDNFSGNTLFVMQTGNSARAQQARDGIMSPEEAWNIDKKMDDGIPDTGNTRAYLRYITAGGLNGNYDSCIDTASSFVYNVDDSPKLYTNECALAFI